MTINQVLMHPLRLQIVQIAAINGSITTTQIGKELPDVPRTTLYRHVSILEKWGVLKVIRTNPIRGTKEKVYVIDTEEMVRKNDPKKMSANVLAFFMELYHSFSLYDARPDADPIRDLLFARIACFNVTDQEFGAMMQEIGNVYQRYMSLPKTKVRRRRRVAMVSMPPEDNNDEKENENAEN